MKDVAVASAGNLRTGRDDGCEAGTRRAAAGRAPVCRARGGRAAAASRPAVALQTAAGRRPRPRRSRHAPSDRRRPRATTMAAVASVRSGYLQVHKL